MCGIAGIVDLRAFRHPEREVLARMSAAITHRGPDEEGFFHAPGVGLASRRLSIVGLHDGQQPIYNEDRSVAVVFNGELFDFREQRELLRQRGHTFRTSCDTEIIVHLWEDFGEEMFAHLRGQFAFALYDERKRVMILARDRVGIAPLHWTQQGDWLYIGSEIKAILASGLVPAEVDPRGLDHIFTFFAMPSRRTMFANIASVVPGHYHKIEFQPGGELAKISEHTYWDLDFPDQGHEYNPPDEQQVIDRFQEAFFRAVDLRLRADVPVVGYLSGGIDSGAVVSAASRVRGSAIPSFTVQIPTPRFDETSQAMMAANYIGSHPTVVTCDSATLAEAYPKVIAAADCPVIDTACAALFCLAGEVHRQGYKVALTGEGSDEALAGYPWFKIDKLLRSFDLGALRPSVWAGLALRRLANRSAPWGEGQRILQLSGGQHAQHQLYSLVSMSRRRFYGDDFFDRLEGHVAFEDLDLNLDRIRRWDPLNQSLYFGYKTMLPGLLLNHKGDRVAMANSVETRYPFLDEDVIAFCAQVHPRWKLRGIRQDKHLLRRSAASYLPEEIVNRPKAMFRAPFADTFFASAPAYVGQLLSPESLRQTGYFDAAQVEKYYRAFRTGASGRRVFVEMGLASVIATQLWHHLYLGGGLCDLPTWSAPQLETPLPV